jgi:hypothetical protein
MRSLGFQLLGELLGPEGAEDPLREEALDQRQQGASSRR